MNERGKFQMPILQAECAKFLGPGPTGYQCSQHGTLQTLWRQRRGGKGCQGCQDFEPIFFPDLEIATAVTTVSGNPERAALLDQTLQALIAARLNDQGITTNYDSPNTPLGPFGNFLVVACYLAARFPNASAYCICQDDTTVAANARQAVETAWRESRNGFPVLSLWTAPEITQARQNGEPNFSPVNDRATGWYRHRGGWQSPGACCYVFSDWGLRDLITSETVWWHRRGGPTCGFRGTDSVVGAWAVRWGGIWHWDGQPLAQHNGLVSTLDRSEPA